jgi:hypothetical protein
MSIGFYLLGELKLSQLDPSTFLKKLEEWIGNTCAELAPTFRTGFVDEKPCLFSHFHPAAEEVEICLADPNHITVSANTSTVGPGYHIYLCDLFRRWTDEFSVCWQANDIDDDTPYGDETGYFFTRNQQAVYDQMQSWLRFLAESFFNGTMGVDPSNVALCMPIDFRFAPDSAAVTQLGPRDRDWLSQMHRGLKDYREFFAWYDTGLSANYYLGRALIQMWSNVRWRKPATANETRLLQSVSHSLETAYRLDPGLDFPWNEWTEVLSFLGNNAPDLPFVRAKANGPGHIGYRRSLVKTRLPGNWWIETEGSFSTFEPDDKGDLSGIDPPREVHFTAFSVSGENPGERLGRLRAQVLAEHHEFAHEEDAYISVADIRREWLALRRRYLLKSVHIGTQGYAVCTLLFAHADDREWALRVWRSIQPSKDENA